MIELVSSFDWGGDPQEVVVHIKACGFEESFKV